MDDLKTGTSKYMSLYPEASTDGALRLGNIIPDFSCETTQGDWESFHEWKKGKVRQQMMLYNIFNESFPYHCRSLLTSLLFAQQQITVGNSVQSPSRLYTGVYDRNWSFGIEI